MTRRSPRELGAVHAIPVAPGLVSGVRRVQSSVCAVHEPVDTELEDATIEFVTASPVLFEVMMSDSAFKPRSGWRHLGLREVTEDERRRVFVFVRTDMLSGRLREFYAGASVAENENTRSLTIDEAMRLEDAAVWDAIDVERRLRARLEGREQGFLSTRLRPWQAQERRERFLAGLEPSRPPEGLVLDRRPEWG